MKGLKVNMDMVNCGLLFVVLVLVVMCCVKREGFGLVGGKVCKTASACRRLRAEHSRAREGFAGGNGWRKFKKWTRPLLLFR
jgi:hypothetical protein